VTIAIDDERLATFPHVFGGEGDDRLTGTGNLYGGDANCGIALGVSVVRADGSISMHGAWGVGGPGDDTVLGSAGEDSLWGDGGTDALISVDAHDFVIEGDTRGENDHDLLDGGAGHDQLNYAGHDQDLLADLRLAT